MTARLVFHDFCHLRHAGFYLSGFGQCQGEYGYGLRVSRTAPAPMCAALTDARWLRLRFAMCVFRSELFGKTQWFCIDGHDSNRLDLEGQCWGYHLPLLDAVDWYFKVNHDADRIATDPVLCTYREKIFPIQQFIPVRVPWRASLVPRVLSSAAASWTSTDARERLRGMMNYPTLESILRLRRSPKDLDVFFVTSFREGDRHDAATDFRARIIRALRDQSGVNCLTGLAHSRPLPAEYADLEAPRFRPLEYLRNLARARVVIYTRGLHDCLSSRFALFLAMGLAIAGQRIVNNAPATYRHEHFRRQFFSDDPLEIAERAVELARNPREADELARLNMATFDRAYTPAAAARTVLQHLGAR